MISVFVFSSIVGINYGFYKLGMWSVKKRLTDTRELLLKQNPQDDLLIEEISNHIVEIDMFNKSKKNISKNK
tara:strand:+ start:1553 stop:1768 length:216 start_codon:yes stop_codon:yes gene_type:complete